HVGATAMEQAFLGDLSVRLQGAISTRQVVDPGRAAQAVDVIHRASSIEHGPPLWVVLLAALAAFWLMRFLVRYRFDGVLGALMLLGGSVIGLNLLLHITISGDLAIWVSGGLVSFVANPDNAFAGRLDLDNFIAN